MTTKTRRAPRYYTPEQWKEIFDDWQESGLSRNAYCEQKDIGFTAFYHWSQKLMNPKHSHEISYSLYTLEQWKEFFEDWQKSGLSREAYSRQKGLAYATFQHWAQKFKDPEFFHNALKLAKGSRLRRYNLEQQKKFVDDWKKSGLSTDDYSREKNLARTTFYNWVQKFKDPEFYERAHKLAQTPAPRHYTLEQQKEYLDDWKKSGLSRDAYCRKKDLAFTTFHTWIQKFKNPEFFEEALKLGQAPAPRRCTLEEQKEYVEGWGKSGLSKETYCRKNNLSSSTFYYWEQKFSRLQSSSPVSKELQKKESALSFQERFIPVTLKPAAVTAAAPVSSANQKVEVVLSQGHRLSLEGSFEWEALAPLLTALLTK